MDICGGPTLCRAHAGWSDLPWPPFCSGVSWSSEVCKFSILPDDLQQRQPSPPSLSYRLWRQERVV